MRDSSDSGPPRPDTYPDRLDQIWFAGVHSDIGGNCLRRALSPTFPAGTLVFFIPLRVVAENPARRIKQ